MVSHLTVNDLPDNNDSDGDEYEGEEAIETLTSVDKGPVDYYDDWVMGWMSVE
jgi:hypothetical protein